MVLLYRRGPTSIKLFILSDEALSFIYKHLQWEKYYTYIINNAIFYYNN